MLKKRLGFTLIEIMIVVIIISILATLIVPKIISRPDEVRKIKAKQDIMTIETALDLYKLDNGFYPTTEQGLKALISPPTCEPLPPNWKSDGYLRTIPIDPWSQPYRYINQDDDITVFSEILNRKLETQSNAKKWNQLS